MGAGEICESFGREEVGLLGEREGGREWERFEEGRDGEWSIKVISCCSCWW